MIRKPAADWQGGATLLTEKLERTVAVVRQGRQVAETGVRAAGTGLYTLQGLLCWGFALLWGTVSLGMLAFGQFPSGIGVGLLSLVAALGGKRSLGRASRIIEYAAPPTEVPRADAHEILYSKSALLVGLVAALGITWLAWHLFSDTRGLATLLLAITVIAGPVLALLCAIRLAGDPLALRWDARSVTIVTLRTRRTLAWSEVSAVTLSRVTSYVWGVVPIGRSTTLGLKLQRGRSIGLTPMLLALNGRSAEALAEELDHCRRSQAHSTIELPDQNGFDPDAIMTRYLAGKQGYDLPAQASPVASSSPKRTFGRKVA